VGAIHTQVQHRPYAVELERVIISSTSRDGGRAGRDELGVSIPVHTFFVVAFGFIPRTYS